MTDETKLTAEDLEIGQFTKEKIPLNLKKVREISETKAIKRALAYTDNHVSNAAKLLGVTRPTLYSLFTKYGIDIHLD